MHGTVNDLLEAAGYSTEGRTFEQKQDALKQLAGTLEKQNFAQEPVTNQKMRFPSVARKPGEPLVQTEFRQADTLTALDPRLTGQEFKSGWDLLHGSPAPVAASVLGVSPDHVIETQRRLDNLVLTGLLLSQSTHERYAHKGYHEIIRESKQFRLWRGDRERHTELSMAIKALDTVESGAGADWIPTGFSADLINRVALELRVATLFDEIPMPTSPFKVPVQGGKATAYKASESTADDATALTGSDAATASAQFTAVKIACRILFSDELTEDSVIPILGYVQGEVIMALADAIENCTVNGDTQGTHFDTGYTVAAADVRRCWNGLRRLANQQTSAASVDLTTLDVGNLLSLKGEMVARGVRPREGAWLTSIAGYIKLLALDECITQDKYGARAVIHTGELAQLFGSPVLVSEHVGQNLNDSGIYDGSTTDKTIVLYVHRPSVKFGRRSSRVETDRIVETQQSQVVAVVRLDMQPMVAAADNPLVGLGYNLAV